MSYFMGINLLAQVPGIYGAQKRMSYPLKIGGTDSCELPRGCWKLNLGSLQGQ